jgi:hypothetical protein
LKSVTSSTIIFDISPGKTQNHHPLFIGSMASLVAEKTLVQVSGEAELGLVLFEGDSDLVFWQKIGSESPPVLITSLLAAIDHFLIKNFNY